MKCKRCPANINIGSYKYQEYEYSCYLMDDCGCRRTSITKLERMK